MFFNKVNNKYLNRFNETFKTFRKKHFVYNTNFFNLRKPNEFSTDLHIKIEKNLKTRIKRAT